MNLHILSIIIIYSKNMEVLYSIIIPGDNQIRSFFSSSLIIPDVSRHEGKKSINSL
jgi:hypothetical protein